MGWGAGLASVIWKNERVPEMTGVYWRQELDLPDSGDVGTGVAGGSLGNSSEWSGPEAVGSFSD